MSALTEYEDLLRGSGGTAAWARVADLLAEELSEANDALQRVRAALDEDSESVGDSAWDRPWEAAMQTVREALGES